MTDNFVRPTTADPRRKFYAYCATCRWQVYGPLFAAICQHADNHVDDCEDAKVLVDTVQYIGHEKTPALLQQDEGRSNQLRSQLQ